MRPRGRSIRRKMVALLLVPLISLVGLWAFATAITARQAAGLMDVADVTDTFSTPVENMIEAVQTERRETLLYLAEPQRPSTLDGLRKSREKTDQRVTAIRDLADGAKANSLLNDHQASRLRSTVKEAAGLETLRRQATELKINRSQAFDRYTEIVSSGYTLISALPTLSNATLAGEARTLAELSRAREAISREDAVVSAALAAGQLPQAQFRALADAVADQRMRYTEQVPELPEPDRATYTKYRTGKTADALHAMEEDLLAAGAAGAPQAVDAQRWSKTLQGILDDLHEMGQAATGHYKNDAKPYVTHAFVNAGIAGGIGLIAVIASIVISVRVGRGLARDLLTLRKAALDLSSNRLPKVMRRLALGEDVDVDAEVAQVEYQGDDEFSEVGRAFGSVHRAALEAAVKQAELRRGISDVFVNLARRSQALLHRQLTLLDSMERRTEDAEELADLFRLDHMTTRMRRHAEGLVILSGVQPSRAWRKPVRLTDVVRAAVAEVEDYERVTVRRLPKLAAVGNAVADLIHLTAELVENATVFSPPHTTVGVHGEQVANGFVLEIDDRGLGMPPEALLEANQRLAETPAFELSDTDRLGLFVVSRLARRQGVKVSLRPSPYGGTTAVVLIPSSLITDEPEDPHSGEKKTAGVAPALDRQPAGPPDRDFTAGGGSNPWVLGPTARAEESQHQQAPDGAGQGPIPDRGSAFRRRRPPVLGSAPPRHGEAHRRRGDDVTVLPRRVRQASLAPQLRGEKPPPDDATGTHRRPGAPPPRERSAEEIRATMESFQRGWQRGRSVADTAEDGETGPSRSADSDPTAPRSTGKGDSQ